MLTRPKLKIFAYIYNVNSFSFKRGGGDGAPVLDRSLLMSNGVLDIEYIITDNFQSSVKIINHFTRVTYSLFMVLFLHDRGQARIQEFTLVGAPWKGEGSGDRQDR